MNDLILAAMHEQSEYAYFTNIRKPTNWIPREEIDWAIEYFSEHPESRSYGYVSF